MRFRALAVTGAGKESLDEGGFMRWTLRSVLREMFPELRHFPEDEQARAWREAASRSRKTIVLRSILGAMIMIGIALFICEVAIFGCYPFFPDELLSSVPWWGRLVGDVAMALFLVWLALAVSWPFLVRQRVRRLLRQALARRGVPICVHCGYDLRGLGGTRCPEC